MTKVTDLLDLCDPSVPEHTVPGPSDSLLRHRWLTDGAVVVPGLVPDSLSDAYCRVREKSDGWERAVTPYMRIPELRNLCCCGEVAKVLEDVLGEPAGVHLNLCGWVSTERDWHQDRYLNPPHVRDVYAAVWLALDTIRPESGPFEWVPGSHLWPALDQSRVIRALLERSMTTPERVRNGAWPWDSEKLLTPLLEREVVSRGVRTRKFLGNKGDVLVWSSRLWHRGSPPERRGTERRSLIAHYTGIHHRPDMPPAVKHELGGYYFPLADWRHPEPLGKV